MAAALSVNFKYTRKPLAYRKNNICFLYELLG